MLSRGLWRRITRRKNDLSDTKNCQPKMKLSHQNPMQLPNLRNVWLIALAVPLVGITACSNKDNPDEIRRQTAAATETMRRDTRAVVEGVKEGMHSDKAVDINTASREDLLSLPGMTERDADRIIAERPFKSAHELVARRVIPQSEYDKISDRVIAGH
jgi:DNA uptake protein ComE-like DNA-binding protein